MQFEVLLLKNLTIEEMHLLEVHIDGLKWKKSHIRAVVKLSYGCGMYSTR